MNEHTNRQLTNIEIFFVIYFLGDSTKGQNLTLFVKCKDALGATSYKEAVITVYPAVVSAAFLAGAQDDITKSFEGGNWNQALGKKKCLHKIAKFEIRRGSVLSHYMNSSDFAPSFLLTI